MMILNVKDKEYKVKFGYNSFCDTDLMDRTEELLKTFQGAGADNDKDVTGAGQIKTLFTCVRDLLYVGFKKHNPVDDVQEIGDLLDDYHDEEVDGEKRSILELFVRLTEELTSAGFLGEMLAKMNQAEKPKKTPQDHKKPQK